MEDKYQAIADKALELGAAEAKLMDADKVVFDPRSHLKCRFGCNRWGQYWTCPPNMDISYEHFMEAYSRYSRALLIKAGDPLVGQEVSLAVEKEAMLTHGLNFAFALVLCVMCEECAYPEPCLHPHLARPSMDAYGIDIMATVALLGFKAELDPKGELLPFWYSMVLLD